MDRLAAIGALANKATNEGWTWGDPVNIEGWDYIETALGKSIANTFHNPIHEKDFMDKISLAKEELKRIKLGEKMDKGASPLERYKDAWNIKKRIWVGWPGQETLYELKPKPQGEGWEDRGEREHDAYPTDERRAEVTELARDMFLQAVGSGGDLQEIKKINFLILADGFYKQVDKHFKG